MSFFEGAQKEMFTLFDTLNSKANQMSESVKTSINSMDSVKSILDETNEKMSKMFSTETPSSASNGEGVTNNNTLLISSVSRCSTAADTTAEDMDGLSELPAFDETLPGYAKPTAYLEESEMCKQVLTTNRKLTEADLDTSDPLYCDRETRENQPGSADTSQQTVENTGLLADFAQCIMDQLQRLKYLILENFMLS